MKTDNIEKNITSPKPLGMPTLEAAWAGIPHLSLSPDSTDDMPTLIDKENCGKEYRVQDGEIYPALFMDYVSASCTAHLFALAELSWLLRFSRGQAQWGP